MQITLTGPLQSGKTTVFNLLTRNNPKQTLRAGNAELVKASSLLYDSRLQQLAEFFSSPIKYIRADLFDTPPLMIDRLSSAPQLQFLKNSDLLLYIVDAFSPKAGDISLAGLKQIAANVKTEFCLHDYLIASNRLEKIILDQKKIHSKELQQEKEFLENIKNLLEKNQPLAGTEFNQFQESLVKGFGLLSLKPVVFIVNCNEANFKKFAEEQNSLLAENFLPVAARLEEELLELDPEERESFIREYDLVNFQFFSAIYPQLFLVKMNLISFFTVGEDECRAWEIKNGTSALLAAGKIHSDIQKGFIRAEVINWRDFLAVQSFSKAKEKGLLRIEGKDYLVKDGEIVHFRFQV